MLLLLIASALLNAVTGYGARYLQHARLYATLGVVLNLLLLAMFKYGGLISNTFFDTSDGMGHFLCMLPLPLGISFYTFSGISLVVDAYRGKAQEPGARPPFLRYVKETLLYITFFPKLLAGPIAKSKDFVAQIGQKTLADVDWTKVFKALVTGYFLKMVIADNMKDFTFWMSYPFSLSFFLSLSLSVFLSLSLSPRSMQDLVLQTHALCCGSMETQPLDYQEFFSEGNFN